MAKSRGSVQEPVAIVGLACRLPGGNDSPQKLWDFLEAGGIASRDVPKTRWSFKGHYDGSLKPKTSRQPGGMFIGEVDLADFDAGFFEVGAAEAISMDPNQRQMLEVVFEGLENAGLPLEALDAQPFGCFVGSYAADYADMHNRDPEDRPSNNAIGVARTALANRLSHFLNIKGPSVTIDTACSGSLQGLDLACRYLQAGDIDGAIVASSNLYMSPEHIIDTGSFGGAHSPTALCHTFDVAADGYVKAEAVSAVIVKRLADAVRDGDPIRGVILGTASSSNGRTPGIASPSAPAQATAIRRAYERAGITDLNLTTYLECHGTGTQAGDPTEINGVGLVFAKTRQEHAPLLVGSIKSNIGHSEPAAGISGLLKTVLAIEHGWIPGTPTFINPSPKIDFAGNKVKAFRLGIPWPEASPKRASINSFGVGGSNAHLIIEQAPAQHQQRHVSSYLSAHEEDDDDDSLGDDDDSLAGSAPDARPRVLLMSANDKTSLEAGIKALGNHLVNPRVRVSLPDLAYTLSERRSQLWHRAFVTAGTTEAAENPEAWTAGKKTGKEPRFGFVFTGQGAQWPRMGADLVRYFPCVRPILEELDGVLQSLRQPPGWTLLGELTEKRTAEHMRRPEFSQPLVTALQLCILAVLETWGVRPSSVVGHSSGEIAAAYSAGLLDRASAITAAFHRGRAAVNRKDDVVKDIGMLAVGLGADAVSAEFLDKHAGQAWIACFNSPSSVTISGRSAALDSLKEEISAAGHFARRLQVDLAYHSELMGVIGDEYDALLVNEPAFKPAAVASSDDNVAMYSSVTGDRIAGPTDAAYWKANMTSPVRFDEALKKMVEASRGPNYLIEIGPSGALAGPVGQLLGSLPQALGNSITYAPSLARGEGAAAKALLDLAGRLWVAGFAIDTAAVGQFDGSERTIVDLPNYRWNHSVKYWHENEASKDWRFRKFLVHDLLGSKVLGVPWAAPIWRSYLDVSNVPYLLDHRLGGHAIMPGAGFLTMALEAIYQKHCALSPPEEVAGVARNDLCYRFRNVRFNRALVLEAGKEAVVTTSLVPAAGGTGNKQQHWHEFRVASTEGGIASEHCVGLVRLQDPVDEPDPDAVRLPLEAPQPARLWYKAEREAGADFGPTFQKMLEVEAVPGQRHCRTLLSLEPAPSAQEKQSYFPVHPAALDGCVQTPYIPNAQCDRTKVKQLMIPNVIDDMIINKVPSQLKKGLARSTAVYSGRGRLDAGKSWLANASVYDAQTGQLAVRITGMAYARLDEADRPDPHTFHAVQWKPDITLLARDQIPFLDRVGDDSDDGSRSSSWGPAAETVMDLAAHKKPGLSVLEISLGDGDGEENGQATSLWLSGGPTRAAYARYDFGTPNAGALVKFGTRHQGDGRISSHLVNPENVAAGLVSGTTGENAAYDLVIVKTPADVDSALLNQAWKDLALFLARDSTRILVQERRAGSDTGDASPPSLSTASPSPSAPSSPAQPSSPVTSESWSDAGSKGVIAIPSESGNSTGDGDDGAPPPLLALPADPSSPLVYVGLPKGPSTSTVRAGQVGSTGTSRRLVVVRLAKSTPPLGSAMRRTLEASGWTVDVHEGSSGPSAQALQGSRAVLVLDEIHRSLLSEPSERQWVAVKDLLAAGIPVLWVTKGAQGSRVTDPRHALVHGLFRVAREEDPLVRAHTLDVQSSTSPATGWAIATVLDLVAREEEEDGGSSAAETEYMERDGVLHVQRIVPDAALNAFRRAEEEGLGPVVKPFYGTATQVSLHAERLGTLQSLVWCETEQPPLIAGTIEVEVKTIGVNFKDVAITMGIVPDNEFNLGFECAGIVTRLGPGVADFQVGDRVCMLKGGSYSNRVTVTIERCHRIPDAMTFEEAATIPSVYLCCLYALYHLGNLQENQSVLIHSATGGVGIACIELARCKNAEIFVTVGTEEKRQFLETNYGIPRSHMFSSRNTKFAGEIMKATGGRGVDVIINSLVGELLDASWRIVADGGNMVEIGKRDIVDRNTLAMEPFDRNCSFRAVDFSYVPHVNEPLIKRLFDELFVLFDAGRIKPINPITTFGFESIVDALSYIRSGRHLGKIVITNGDKEDINLPIRPAVRRLQLRSDVSYLIVGGLKGACGTLAIHMAEHGARHILVCSRSGLNDSTSSRVIASCKGYGCSVTEARCDIGDWEATLNTFKTATPAIGGIIQGAMVLRDKPLETMSLDDYVTATHAKVQGTWNLHRAAQEALARPLDFFTLLSSVSGIVGNKGQANYAAANAFLDAFASYRHAQGLAANTVDLGLIEDVGYVAEQETQTLEHRFDKRKWTPINEAVLRRILTYSVLQQDRSSPIHAASAAQTITGIGFPLPVEGSETLAREPRFGHLFNASYGAEGGAGAVADAGAAGGGGGGGGDETEQAIQQFKVLVASGTGSATDTAKLTAACLWLAAAQFGRILRLEAAPEPGRPLVAYGLDSLAAVELRNWVRRKLAIELTTLDITSAPSLIALCEKMVAKLPSASSQS